MKPSREHLRIGVVGATGAVGGRLLSILLQRNFPFASLRVFGSDRSVGKILKVEGHSFTCERLTTETLSEFDLLFFDTPDEVAREWVPKACEAGVWVIDNSAAFRYGPENLIVVPEVNAAKLRERLAVQNTEAMARVLANPNCSTAQLVVALYPLHQKYGLKRVVLSSYQSTSGAGVHAMDELRAQSLDYLNSNPLRVQALQHQIAFNVIPHIGGLDEFGNTSEERKIAQESRSILGIPNLKITATAVRVPTLHCHAEAVNVEFEQGYSNIAEVRELLSRSPGIVVLDSPAEGIYPMPEAQTSPDSLTATGRDAVYVGRIRKDESAENALNLWIVSDNLRKGAALNAVQIGEMWVETVCS